MVILKVVEMVTELYYDENGKDGYLEWIHKGCGGHLRVLLDVENRNNYTLNLICARCGWSDTVLLVRFRRLRRRWR